MSSTFLVTLGESLRRVLDNVVQGLPLQNTAGELLKDLTTFSLSLPVRFICFRSKIVKFLLRPLFMLWISKHFVWEKTMHVPYSWRNVNENWIAYFVSFLQPNFIKLEYAGLLKSMNWLTEFSLIWLLSVKLDFWAFPSFTFNIQNLLLIEFSGSCWHITKRNT